MPSGEWKANFCRHTHTYVLVTWWCFALSLGTSWLGSQHSEVGYDNRWGCRGSQEFFCTWRSKEPGPKVPLMVPLRWQERWILQVWCRGNTTRIARKLQETRTVDLKWSHLVSLFDAKRWKSMRLHHHAGFPPGEALLNHHRFSHFGSSHEWKVGGKWILLVSRLMPCINGFYYT